MTKPLMEFDQLIVETDSSIELGIDTIRSRERTEVLSGTWGFTKSIPTSMSDPRMCVEALKWYMGVHLVIPASIPDPPLRTLLLQRTRVKVALWRGRR